MSVQKSEWEMTSPESLTDPIANDRRMRSTCPVAHSSDFGGFYALFKYDDVEAAAKDTATFSSARTATVPASHPDGTPSIPLQSDPPMHRAYRSVLVPLFRGSRLRSFEPTLVHVANDLIDGFADDDVTEMATEYCVALPAAALCLLMGLPLDDWRLLHKWVVGENAEIAKGDPEARMKVQKEIYAYCDAAIERARSNPGDNVMTAMLNAEIDGRPMTSDEMHGMFQVLIGAGHETVANNLASALHYLAERPDEADRLRKNPELLDSAVEELVRWAAPVRALGRSVTTDTEIRGRNIPGGSLVAMMWASAARDGDVYPDPDVCDFERDFSGVTNISFGVGLHRCIGEHLARLEMKVGIREVLQRFETFELAGEPERSGWPTIGFRRLPIAHSVKA